MGQNGYIFWDILCGVYFTGIYSDIKSSSGNFKYERIHGCFNASMVAFDLKESGSCNKMKKMHIVILK